MSLLECKQVSFAYPHAGSDLVQDLSFSVEEGAFHCLIGISGSGKSTLFRLLAGLVQAKSGEILLHGRPLMGSPAKGQAPAVGYMPQKDLLFPWRTIGENLALPLEIQGKTSRAQRREKVHAALEEVGLFGYQDRYPEELSGGMRQRAAFARTMLTGSDLFLLDEPFSALDFLTRISMQEWLLDQWRRQKKTILFITHDVEEAVFLSTSVLVVEEKPIRSLREVPIPLGLDRSRKDLSHPDLVEVQAQLMDTLRKQVSA